MSVSYSWSVSDGRFCLLFNRGTFDRHIGFLEVQLEESKAAIEILISFFALDQPPAAAAASNISMIGFRRLLVIKTRSFHF